MECNSSISGKSLRLLVISDPQVGNSHQEQSKCYHLDILERQNHFNSIDAVLFPGDLTETGSNNHWYHRFIIDIVDPIAKWLKFPANWVNVGTVPWWRERYREPQVNTFVERWVQPFQKKNIPVYLCLGNHDVWMFWINPAEQLVKRMHGSRVYDQSLNDEYHLFTLDIFPDTKTCNWLKKRMESKELQQKYAVLMFHYPPEGGMSGMQSQDQIEYFERLIIKPLKSRIACLCVGHYHTSNTYFWNDIPVINASGNQYAIVELKTQKPEAPSNPQISSAKLNVQFFE